MKELSHRSGSPLSRRELNSVALHDAGRGASHSCSLNAAFAQRPEGPAEVPQSGNPGLGGNEMRPRRNADGR